jgi:KDO2-lipid IV(A) lauroyltransferase
MIGYIIYKTIQAISFILPLKWVYKICTLVSCIYYIFAKNARNAVLYNLRHAFKNSKTDAEIKKISKKIFENFGKGIINFCRFSSVNNDFIKKNVKIHNLDYVEESLKKTGVIGLTGHIGSWELGGIVLAILGYPVNAVALPHNRRQVEKFFVAQRQKKGLKVIPLGKAYRTVYRKLLSKEFVALLADRIFSASGVKVKCFGQTIKVSKGPAMLSIKTSSPVVPGFMIRKGGKFHLIFHKPIFPKSIKAVNLEEKIQKLSFQYAKVMQNYIEKYPDQWFLFYKLFIE